MMLAGAEFRKVIFSHSSWSSWPQVLLAAICSCGSWEIHGNKTYQELLTTERLPLIPEQHHPPVLKALLETSQKWLLWWAVLHLSVAGLSALHTDTVQVFLLTALPSRDRRDRSGCLGFVQLNYALPLVACRNCIYLKGYFWSVEVSRMQLLQAPLSQRVKIKVDWEALLENAGLCLSCFSFSLKLIYYLLGRKAITAIPMR